MAFHNMNCTHRFILFGACIAVCTTAVTARAQDLSQQTTRVQSFTFSEALEQVGKTNLSLIAAEQKLISVQKQENVALGGFLPKVTGTISGTEYDSKQVATDSKYSVSSQLTVSQNLFTGFNDHNKLNQAQANTKASQENLKSIRAKTYAELKQVYQKSIYSKDYIVLAEKIAKRRLDNYRLVELRFNSGRENKGNVYLFKAYTEQANLDQLQAENAKATAQLELAKVLGLDQDLLADVADHSLPVTPLPQTKPDFFSLVKKHPDYLAAVAQEEATAFEFKSARSGFFPSLDLSASYGYTDTKFYPQANERWSAGLTLTLPFFNGGRDLASYQSTMASWKAQSASRAQSEKQLLLNLQTAYASYQEAVQKVKVDESFKQAASVRADIAKNKYNNGLLAFENWDQVENDFIQREKSLLSSQRDLVNAEANWLLAQGLDSNEGLKSSK